MRKLSTLLSSIALAILLGVSSFHDMPTEAAFIGADISSSGPLNHIYIGQGLSCQVAHVDDAEFAFSPSNDQQGGCGTFLLVGGLLYGADNQYTFVTQTGVTGAGSSADPFQVVTVVDAGETGIRLTQTDSYVTGDAFYRTDVQLQNLGNTTVGVRVYRGADCYLGGTGEAYGFVGGVSESLGCSVNPNNVPTGRMEAWTPITPFDHFVVDEGMVVGPLLFSGDELTDTCLCDALSDNAAVVDWNRTIAAGESATVSHFTTFSFTGSGVPTPTSAQQTATPVRTNTRTPTATTTPTPVPPTLTPTIAASVTQEVIPTQTLKAFPPQQNGGAMGNIGAPNAGSGASGGSTHLRAAFIAGALFLAAGTGAVGVACRVGSKSARRSKL